MSKISSDQDQSSMSEYQYRRLRCTIIGAGVSGISMAYKLRKHLGDYVDFTIYEKNPELGGTWYENRYPGCAGDVPSHCYQFPWAPNPSWSKFYVSSREIQSYLRGVVHHFGLGRFIRYNTTIVHAQWSETNGTWSVKLDNGQVVESEILVNASGILNNAQVPNIEGLDLFKGPRMHTATWDSSIPLKGKTINIIGAGASAIQLLPELQPIAGRINIFIRTPSWITPPVGLPETESFNFLYKEAEKDAFRWNDDQYLEMRKKLEGEFNGMFKVFFKASDEQRKMRYTFESRMRSLIKNEELQKKLVPPFEAGCRRINPGEKFLVSLQEPNVEPVFDAIEKMTPNGIIIGSKEYHADVLVTATGFDTTFRPRFPIIGRNNIDLRDLWAEDPASYLGTGVAGFPNYFIFLGPNTPISNGSVMGSLEATGDYFIRILRKMIRQNVKSVDVRADAQQDFNTHTQAYMKQMVWTGSCRSWYKKGTDGKITGLWPGSSLHYIQFLAENRWEDYEWEYPGERYAYWNQGISWVERPEGDVLGIEEREAWDMTSIPRRHSDLAFYLYKSSPLPQESLSAWEETIILDGGEPVAVAEDVASDTGPQTNALEEKVPHIVVAV